MQGKLESLEELDHLVLLRHDQARCDLHGSYSVIVTGGSKSFRTDTRREVLVLDQRTEESHRELPMIMAVSVELHIAEQGHVL